MAVQSSSKETTAHFIANHLAYSQDNYGGARWGAITPLRQKLGLLSLPGYVTSRTKTCN